ncbi:hypothetical protein CDAR_485901 [Caerostris darwini]|uniref:Uncharacterized protein n=1 Tax=Caerostris darwini TaxID=1538125 RepID=A0AAV4WIJ4_9ARAC|nr:hypothetical protein CDAR_485901 [Caerostris darwini]
MPCLFLQIKQITIREDGSNPVTYVHFKYFSIRFVVTRARWWVCHTRDSDSICEHRPSSEFSPARHTNGQLSLNILPKNITSLSVRNNEKKKCALSLKCFAIISSHGTLFSSRDARSRFSHGAFNVKSFNKSETEEHPLGN